MNTNHKLNSNTLDQINAAGDAADNRLIVKVGDMVSNGMSGISKMVNKNLWGMTEQEVKNNANNAKRAVQSGFRVLDKYAENAEKFIGIFINCFANNKK